MEKMVDSIQRAEGGNYGNAGLSVSGCWRGLSMMSHCSENQICMFETALV